MPDGTTKPFRLTRGKLAWEVSTLIIAGMFLWRFFTWGWRRCKPIFYHPVALAGLCAFLTSYLLTPWVTLGCLAAVASWAVLWPDSYLRHVNPRAESFLAGFKYRHRPRRKLEANGLLNDKDPIPTISHVAKHGCVTRVRIKMSDGDEINYWQERSRRIAQTYNAADCRINPYIRETLNPFSHELVPKYRWLEIDFLTRDPFAKPVGVEYIELHRTQIVTAKNQKGEEVDIYQDQEGDPVGPTRDGSPYILDVTTHLLNVSMTGGGKSNAERTMVYAGYPKVMAGLRENWGCDLARGVELGPMKHCFTRVEDGKNGPQAVLQFWLDVRNFLWQRLDKMEANGIVLFEPTPGDPGLDVYFDEMAILETVAYAQVRKAIYATMSEILVQGRKAKIRIFAFTQKAKLDDLPLREDFPETHLGRVKSRRQVAMAMDTDAYDRGARANDIRTDQPGIYYAETRANMAPIDFRFCITTLADMRRLPKRPDSAVWPLPFRILPDLPAPALTSQPTEPDPELQPAGRLTDL